MGIPSKSRSSSWNLNEITVRRSDCCKLDWLNSILMILRTNADNQQPLFYTQRLAGNAVGARVAAQQALKVYEPLHKEQPNDTYLTMALARAYALIGKRTWPSR